MGLMSNSCFFKYFRYFLFLFLISFLSIPISKLSAQGADSLLNNSRKLKAEELIRGERLFYGLVYMGSKSINCVECHNTVRSETLNWNPDALDISKKYLDKSPSDLSKVLLKPSGEKMSQVHKGFQFTPEDIVLLKGYMDEFSAIGIKQKNPVITNLFLFIVASMLILFSFTDLIITKKIKKTWIHLIIILITGLFITRTLVVDAIAIGHSPEYAPDQPVKFSHAVHAGQNQTDCIYCHSYAEYSKVAGIPAENICMNCHLLVRNGTRSGVFEIAKVISKFEEKVPIEWIKVYNLPDHVFFSHAQHVSSGGLNCRECHGDVEKMDRVILNNELTMGWCIDCHRTKNVNFKENKFYTEYKELAGRINKGEINSITVSMIGGTECMKCHY